MDVTNNLLGWPKTEGQTRDSWASSDFYGKWLLAAAKVDAVWQKVKAEPRYEKQLERVPKNYPLAFGPTAFWLVSQLASNSFTAIVSLNGKEEELRRLFLTARYLGFFTFPNKHYEMRLPAYVSTPVVKNAVLAGFRVNDRKCHLRPEYSSPTMPYAEARARQEWLCEIRKNYRRTGSGIQRLHIKLDWSLRLQSAGGRSACFKQICKVQLLSHLPGFKALNRRMTPPSQHRIDALHNQIMDFDPLVVGDLTQRLINRFRQVETGMN